MKIGDILDEANEEVVIVDIDPAGGFTLYATSPLATIQEYINRQQHQLDILREKFA